MKQFSFKEDFRKSMNTVGVKGSLMRLWCNNECLHLVLDLHYLNVFFSAPKPFLILLYIVGIPLFVCFWYQGDHVSWLKGCNKGSISLGCDCWRLVGNLKLWGNEQIICCSLTVVFFVFTAQKTPGRAFVPTYTLIIAVSTFFVATSTFMI